MAIDASNNSISTMPAINDTTIVTDISNNNNNDNVRHPPVHDDHPYFIAQDKFHLPPIKSPNSATSSPSIATRVIVRPTATTITANNVKEIDSEEKSNENLVEEKENNDSEKLIIGNKLIKYESQKSNNNNNTASSNNDQHLLSLTLLSPSQNLDPLTLSPSIGNKSNSQSSAPEPTNIPAIITRKLFNKSINKGNNNSRVHPSSSIPVRPRRRSSVNDDDVSIAARGSASALHPFWLRFRRYEIENFYLDFSSDKNDEEAWRLIILSLFLYLVPFLIHQSFLSPFDYRFLLVRIGIFIPIFILLLFRYNSEYFNSPVISQFVLLIISLIFFLGENFDSFTLGDNQGLLETGTIIFFFWVFPALHLRFPHALTVTALTLITRLIFTIILALNLSPNFCFHASIQKTFATNAIITLGHEAIIFIVGLASLAYCWHSERLERREFWYRNLLAETVENNQILLQRMLPSSVIAKLQKGDTIIAERFDHVTLLFADLVGFSLLVASTSPVFVVHVLDHIFNAFDELSEQYGVYKVETVFDTWVGACGIQNEDEEDFNLTREEREKQRLLKIESEQEILFKQSVNATRIAQLALAMVKLGEQLEIDIRRELESWEKKSVKKYENDSAGGQSSGGETTDEENDQQRLSMINAENEINSHQSSSPAVLLSSSLSLKVRVGLHSGGVMAGVIGRKLPRYRLFGDTVNTTARMCTNGEGGRVHVSPETELILNDSEVTPAFTFCDHATRKIKGKGLITTGYLVRDDSVLNQTVQPVYANNSIVTFAAPEIIRQTDENQILSKPITAATTTTNTPIIITDHVENIINTNDNISNDGNKSVRPSPSTSPLLETKRSATPGLGNNISSPIDNNGNSVHHSSSSPLNRLLALTRESRLMHSHTFHSKPYFSSRTSNSSATATLSFADLVHRNTQLQNHDSFEHWAEEARMTMNSSSISPTSLQHRNNLNNNTSSTNSEKDRELHKTFKHFSHSIKKGRISPFNTNHHNFHFQHLHSGNNKNKSFSTARHRAMTAGADSHNHSSSMHNNDNKNNNLINGTNQNSNKTRRGGSAFVKKSRQSTNSIAPAPLLISQSVSASPVLIANNSINFINNNNVNNNNNSTPLSQSRHTIHDSRSPSHHERFGSPLSINRSTPTSHSYSVAAARRHQFPHDSAISVIESVGSAEHSENDFHHRSDSRKNSRSQKSHRKTLSKNYSPRETKNRLKGYLSHDRLTTPTMTGINNNNPNPSSRASASSNNTNYNDNEERIEKNTESNDIRDSPSNHTRSFSTTAIPSNNREHRKNPTSTSQPLSSTDARSQSLQIVRPNPAVSTELIDNSLQQALNNSASSDSLRPLSLCIDSPAAGILRPHGHHPASFTMTPGPTRKLRPSHKRAVTLNDKDVKSMLGLSINGKMKKNQIIPVSTGNNQNNQNDSQQQNNNNDNKLLRSHRSMQSMQLPEDQINNNQIISIQSPVRTTVASIIINNDTEDEINSVQQKLLIQSTTPQLQFHQSSSLPISHPSISIIPTPNSTSTQATPRSNLIPTPTSGDRSMQHSPTVNSHHLPLPSTTSGHYLHDENDLNSRQASFSAYSQNHPPISASSSIIIVNNNAANIQIPAPNPPISPSEIPSARRSRHQSLTFSRSSRMNNISELKKEKEKQQAAMIMNKQIIPVNGNCQQKNNQQINGGDNQQQQNNNNQISTIAEIGSSLSSLTSSTSSILSSSQKSVSMLSLASLDTDDLPFHMLNPETMKFGYDLSFVDYPDLEKKYQQDQQRKIYQWIKTRLLLLLAAFIIVSAIDLLARLINLADYNVNNGPILMGTNAWIRFTVRICAGFIPCLIIVFVMIYSRTVRKLYKFSSYLNHSVLLLLSILSAILFVTDINLPNPNIDTWCGVIVLCGLASSLFRLPATHNLLFVIWCTLCYTITFLFVPVININLVIYDRDNFHLSIVVQCLLFCICMFLLFYVNSRVMEIRTRERFLTLLAIKKQRKDTSALLERLLPKAIIQQLIDMDREENGNYNQQQQNSNYNGNNQLQHQNHSEGESINNIHQQHTNNINSNDSIHPPVNRTNRRQMSLASQSINIPSINRRPSTSRAFSYQLPQRPATSDGNKQNHSRLPHSNSHSIKFTDRQRSTSIAGANNNNHHQITNNYNHNYNQTPITTTEQLSTPGSLLASIYPSVTVMQADVCSFTPLCARSTAQQVITMLNSLFLLFDGLTDQYKVYKVETIGDAVLAVCGAPIPDSFHALRMAELSLAARDALRQFTPAHEQTPIKMRFGLHSGKVVGGVVGLKKMPRFHIYGQTVIHAGLMEQQAEPMTICMSETTWKAIKQNDPQAKQNYEVKRILTKEQQQQLIQQQHVKHSNSSAMTDDTPNQSEDEPGTSKSETDNDDDSDEEGNYYNSKNNNNNNNSNNYNNIKEKSLSELRCYQLVRKRKIHNNNNNNNSHLHVNNEIYPVNIRPVTASSNRAAKLTGDDPMTLAAGIERMRNRASTDLLSTY